MERVRGDFGRESRARRGATRFTVPSGDVDRCWLSSPKPKAITARFRSTLERRKRVASAKSAGWRCRNGALSGAKGLDGAVSRGGTVRRASDDAESRRQLGLRIELNEIAH